MTNVPYMILIDLMKVEIQGFHLVKQEQVTA